MTLRRTCRKAEATMRLEESTFKNSRPVCQECGLSEMLARRDKLQLDFAVQATLDGFRSDAIASRSLLRGAEFCSKQAFRTAPSKEN